MSSTNMSVNKVEKQPAFPPWTLNNAEIFLKLYSSQTVIATEKWNKFICSKITLLCVNCVNTLNNR